MQYHKATPPALIVSVNNQPNSSLQLYLYCVIIIVGETHMRFCLRYIANPYENSVFIDRHYCNYARLSSPMLQSCGTSSAKNGVSPFPRQ